MPSCSSHTSSYGSMDTLLEQPAGLHRIKYRGAGDDTHYDYALETEDRPIDVSLVLPHYRAHCQPLDHTLNMYVGSENAESIKVKVCRKFMPSHTTKFRLEIHAAGSADVTVWLPSDFKGRIHRSSNCRKVGFSAGFTNRIMQNVCLTQSRRPSVVSMSDHSAYRFSEIYVSDRPGRLLDEKLAGFGAAAHPEEDEVVVETTGAITFRMWDIHRCEPESVCREACKRALSLGWCSKRSPEVAIDWDFLLED